MPSKRKAQDDVSEDPPTSIDPYAVLSIDKDASEDDVKKAYRKAALKHHPDKATGAAASTAKEDFQKVAFAYAILSDPRRRKRYDVTGSTSESIDLEDDDFNWVDFFRAQYQQITTDAIASFTSKYKNSDEERTHLLEAYTKGKGNLDVVYETVMASNVLEDDTRFRAIIDEAIKNEGVKAYDKYTKETEKTKERRFKKAEREAKEAEEAVAEEKKQSKEKASKGSKVSKDKGNGLDELAALIQQRQQSRSKSFIDQLEEKYGDPAASGKKRRKNEEPSEEAFAEMADRTKKRKARK